MGRLIDTNDLYNKVMLNKRDWGIFATQIDNLIEGIVMQVPTVEAIPKDQYENRLKADMVAMLTEIQQEIEEIEMGNNVPFGFETVNKFYEGVSASSKVIQQKIDALKAESEG